MSWIAAWIGGGRKASDRWGAALGKAGEYLNAGTPGFVCIVDPAAGSVTLCQLTAAPLTCDTDQTLELPEPELHPEFTVSIRSLLA